MICTANDLLGWKDFPNGLSVLLLDEDTNFAAQMKSRLEDMKYIVSWFQNENEALLAITSKSMQFHVAIVEVNTSKSNEVYKFLETAKDLPTILMSNVHCLNTMMKCIALGAVEFLQKPLSDDKLRNIWQHALHKAFNAGGKDVSESLKPVKESLVTMLQIQCPNESEQSNTSLQENKCPAPSTPQLKQGGIRSTTDDQTQDSSMEQEGEYKFVETTFSDSVFETTPPGVGDDHDVVKRERESSSEHTGQNGNSNRCERSKDARGNRKKTLGVNASSETTKACKRKLKVDWTPELHKKFVQAVEQLGLDQAIPSRILELMKIEGLTRHNVASHLQKYRMHRRQILPKQDERRWLISRDPTQRTGYPHKLPVMAFPQYHHAANALPAGQFYSPWVQPGSYPGVHVWGSPFPYPEWQRPEDWNWKTNPAGVYGHAWGCPIMPPPQGSSYPTYPQNALVNCSSGGAQDRYNVLGKAFDVHPAEEVIDSIVKEAINNPWLPLPLGLNPPSTDSVLYELSKQGISTIPPLTNGSDSR